jgi:lipoprotein-anchoring transpeptidase ErfK/SrfK
MGIKPMMRRNVLGAVGLTVVLLLVAGVMALYRQSGTAPRPAAAAAAAAPPTPHRAALEVSVTPVPRWAPIAVPKWGVLATWDHPNGNLVGAIAATTWGQPTARPVLQVKGAWVQVRLDTRPNGSTAWVAREDVTLSTTPFWVVLSVSQRTITLYRAGIQIYRAPVGVGQPQWATPTGPSFVDALVPVPLNQQYIYGPLVLITGTHSNVFTDFDGGDGTVGIHGYPSDPASTQGVASSHGCIRANPQTIQALSQVPAGTPFDINP